MNWPRVGVGDKFGRLTVLARRPNEPGQSSMWLCQCECGNKPVVRASTLKSGGTRSCGCLRSEITAKRNRSFNFKHGLCSAPIYAVWMSMVARCRNPKNAAYPYYGGRGIKVCRRWLTFENFHADMAPRPDGLTLDRIDNNGDYEPGNCRWTDWKTQRTNQRPALRGRWNRKAGRLP
jgi:hypothetical protein